MAPTAALFILFLLAFVAVGVYAMSRRRATADDYLVASRSVHPWLTSLSAVATNNSGFMFLGLIAETYLFGIRAAWLMVGWVLGDWMAWFFVHRRLREQSEARGSRTIPGFLGGDLSPLVVAVAGLIVLVFLGLYAAAQLNAGGKALHYVFEWDLRSGAIIGAVIVAVYCFAGGIRASIWTDAAQSVVMLGAMLLLVATALVEVGGPAALWSRLEAIDPELTVLAPSDYRFGFAGYLLGWIGAGAGVIGQPHVMIRAMAIDSADNMAKARRIYIGWYAIFAAACIAVGLAARVLLPEAPADAELSLPILAGMLLPAVLVGLMLAGIFAATISTADSQILSCSAAVTHDLVPTLGERYAAIKLATIGVTGLALLMALFGPDSVFKLVTMAWATLAAGLGPLMVIRVFHLRINAPVALAMMIGGVAGALVWRLVLEWHGDMYDVLPGMIAGFAVYAIAIRLYPVDGTRPVE
jgi:sodium/proline symporter